MMDKHKLATHKLLGGQQLEVRLQFSLERIEPRYSLSCVTVSARCCLTTRAYLAAGINFAAQPQLTWCVVLQPRVWRGDDEQSALDDQRATAAVM